METTITQHDSPENEKIFGRSITPEMAEMFSLKPGQVWSIAHECDNKNCNLRMNLCARAAQEFGVGKTSARHTGKVIAIWRKE